jgi:hypothetical protein
MMTEATTAQQEEERNDRTPEQASSFWQVQLALAEKDHQTWHQDGQSVVDRYKNERARALKKDNSKSFNILFSNVETLKAALYGRAAKPDVRRRFGDKDPTARMAAEVIERGLLFCAETYDVDKPLEAGLHDHLLPGRGVVRVVYEPVFGQEPVIDPMTMMPAVGPDGQPMMRDVIQDQKLFLQYVYWKDYLQAPARQEGDVWWRAFRHSMSREDLRENQFEDADAVPLNWAPNVGDGKKEVPEHLKKAEVWEIWDKSRRERVWIVKGHTKALRVDPDPYGLADFFPLPEPLVALADTETTIPQPEFFVYKDQADDLDEITARISRLTKALKRRGVYDQAIKELKRLARAGDNEFIPVENYAALSQKGGLQAAFQTEDVTAIASVLNELYKQRDMLVQGIYEVSGIADIMRGSSDPNETLGAQQLKAQFGSQRLKKRQRAVQKWIRDLYKLKAEIIAEHFEPQVLSEMTGQEITPEVIELLRSDKLRSYRIDIETDSTVFEDAEGEKRTTIELLTAVGGFLQQAVASIPQAPEMAPLLFEMLSMGVRTFKQGKRLEDVIEQTREAIEQKIAMAEQQAQMAAQMPPQPDPGQIAAERKNEVEMGKMDREEERDQAKHAREMERLAASQMQQPQVIQ